MITRISYHAIVRQDKGGLIETKPSDRRHGTVVGFTWHGLDGFSGAGNVVAIVLQDGGGSRPVLVPVRQAEFGLIGDDTEMGARLLAAHYLRPTGTAIE